MILLLDVGSTRIKWASLEQGQLHYGGGIVHQGMAFGDLAQSLWGDLRRPARVLAANVAGAGFAETLAAWTRERWSVDPELVTPQQHAYGVTNAYLEPRQLGADRWAALVAARSKNVGAAVIVDCGTAMTIDALAADGKHLGGLIVPGLDMMRRALVERTQGIAAALEIEVESRADLLARDTRGGIAAGTLYTVIALIDRVAADIAAELHTPVTCIVTGGDSPNLLPLLAAQCRHEPHLVLQGLAIMAQGEAEAESPA